MKADLVDMITHDMRNPILSMQKVLQLIVTGTIGPLTVQQKNVMELALATCQQLSGMVGDILDIYRNENGQFVLHRTPVYIEQIVTESFSQLDIYAKEKGISMHFESPQFPLEVMGDKKRLRRALVNLMENAIKYSPEDSIVEVEAQVLNGDWPKPGMAKSAVSGQPPLKGERDRLMLMITDHGIGIPSEYHECIFDKYFSIRSDSESRREGIGLGLAFCKQVVEAHGGSIWVESPIVNNASDHRQGCRFYVTLPNSFQKSRA